MDNVIQQAKADFLRAKKQIARAFASTPDDRINWSPSPTARTPVNLVVHAAGAIKNIHDFLDGRPFEVTDPHEADAFFRADEARITSREEAVAFLEESSDRYVAWLDALTPDRLSSPVTLPFGMGEAPLAVGLSFAPAHTLTHAAQIEYIQTIYGDRDWHM